jgi:hypothetical protein
VVGPEEQANMKHPAQPGPDESSTGRKRVGERRWPMAIAVLTVGALHATLPADFRLIPGWVFQALLVAFLGVLIIGDPGRIDREKTWLRVTTDVMVAVITVTRSLGGAQLLMMCESAVSLVVALLVIARAINILPQ